MLQLVFNAKNIVDFHCDISGYLRQKNIDFDVFHKSFHIFGILGGTTHNVVNFSHNIVDAFVERCTLLCTLFSLLVFCFYRVEIFVKSVLFGDASIELSHEAFFLIDEFVIFSRLLLGLQALLSPFLLNLFSGTAQLQIFLEAKHILEVVTNGLCEHILFKKFARLHSIKKEILAQLLRQVRLDNLVYLLLVLDALFGGGHSAVHKHIAIHVQADAFERFPSRIKDVCAFENIFLFLSEDFAAERNLQ